MNAATFFFILLHWTADLCMLDMTQWWNEQSKANPPNSQGGSVCGIQIQAAHHRSKAAAAARTTVCTSRQNSTQCLSTSCLQFRLCTMPSYQSYVRIRYTSNSTGPDLPRLTWPPTCNSNNASTAKVMPLPRPTYTPAVHSLHLAIDINRFCPIQCVFIFLHVSCQASYTMSAIGFCWINIFPNSLL